MHATSHLRNTPGEKTLEYDAESKCDGDTIDDTARALVVDGMAGECADPVWIQV